MAQVLNEFSYATGFDSDQLVQFAGQVLSNGIAFDRRGRGPDFRITLIPPVSDRYAVPFGESGFRRQYQSGGNQVRHFIAYFAAGAKYDLPNVTSLLAEIRDRGDQPDIELGILAARLGREAAGSQRHMENIGRIVRDQVCN